MIQAGDVRIIELKDIVDIIVIQEWKNTVHVVTAIIQLRQQFNNQPVDEHIVNVR